MKSSKGSVSTRYELFFKLKSSQSIFVSMSKDVNLKHFAKLERTWLGHLDSGRKVDVKIKVNYVANKRPTSFDVSYKVDGGETIKQHIKN